MASGHVNRVNRPNTWPQPTSCTVKKTPCQQGAVHTWHIASFRYTQGPRRFRSGADIASVRHAAGL